MNKDHYWMCLDAFRSQQDSQKLDSIYIMLYNAEQERKAPSVIESPSSPLSEDITDTVAAKGALAMLKYYSELSDDIGFGECCSHDWNAVRAAHRAIAPHLKRGGK